MDVTVIGCGYVGLIQAVGLEGKGNTEAAAAWKTLSMADTSAMLPLLAAMKGASPMAQN